MTLDRSRRMSLAFERLEDRWNPADFTVTNGSWNPATQNSQPWCVAQANASAGVDDIYFNFEALNDPNVNPSGGGVGNPGGNAAVTLTSTAMLSVTEGVRIWGNGVTLTGETPFQFTHGNDQSEIRGMAFDNCRPSLANVNSNWGGAIRVLGGQVTTFNTRFTNNSAANGGAAYVDVNGTLVLDGDQTVPSGVANYPEQVPVNGWSRTLFQNNNSGGGDGGAISNEGTLILKRVTFAWNTAGNRGGAINNNDDAASIVVPVAPPGANGNPNQGGVTDVTFKNNTAKQGGAISVKRGTVSLIGVKMVWNGATADGGALCVLGGTVSVKDSIIQENVAFNGAAVYILGAGGAAPTVDLRNVTFGGNGVRPGGTAAIDVSTNGTLNTHGCKLNGDLIVESIAAGQATFGVYNPDPNDPDTP